MHNGRAKVISQLFTALHRMGGGVWTDRGPVRTWTDGHEHGPHVEVGVVETMVTQVWLSGVFRVRLKPSVCSQINILDTSHSINHLNCIVY